MHHQCEAVTAAGQGMDANKCRRGTTCSPRNPPLGSSSVCVAECTTSFRLARPLNSACMQIAAQPQSRVQQYCNRRKAELCGVKLRRNMPHQCDVGTAAEECLDPNSSVVGGLKPPSPPGPRQRALDVSPTVCVGNVSSGFSKT